MSEQTDKGTTKDSKDSKGAKDPKAGEAGEFEDTSSKKEKKDRRAQAKKAAAAVGDSANRLRTLAARIVWALAVLFAIVLAAGALLIALDANRDNGLVSFVLDAADNVDLGVFSRTDGVKQFDGENRELKNALFNWGLGAVAWLVIGRLLDRVIRP